MAVLLPAQEVPQSLSQEEKLRRLIDATEKFMRGEISVEQFEEAERSYMPDYHSAMVTLAKRRREGRDRARTRFPRRQAKRLVAY